MPASPQLDIAALKGVPLFDGLDAAALADIRRHASGRDYAAGEVLFRQEDPANIVYVVQSGRIRVSELTEAGDEVLLRFIEPGQMLGAMATLERMRYPVTAEAAVDSRVLAWSHEDIDQAVDKYSRLARNIMRLMVGRIRELQERCVELATERVEQRIARAVLRLAGQVGKRTAQGIALDMRLSRQDLAALTGTTLFTVSRTLNRWSERGILSLGRERVVLQQPHELVRIADNLPP